MENTILEALLISWWKGILIILAIAFSAVVIRVSVNLDLNEWLKRRETAKHMDEIKEARREMQTCVDIIPEQLLLLLC